jgi:hypothetical protein
VFKLPVNAFRCCKLTDERVVACSRMIRCAKLVHQANKRGDATIKDRIRLQQELVKRLVFVVWIRPAQQLSCNAQRSDAGSVLECFGMYPNGNVCSHCQRRTKATSGEKRFSTEEYPGSAFAYALPILLPPSRRGVCERALRVVCRDDDWKNARGSVECSGQKCKPGMIQLEDIVGPVIRSFLPASGGSWNILSIFADCRLRSVYGPLCGAMRRIKCAQHQTHHANTPAERVHAACSVVRFTLKLSAALFAAQEDSQPQA